MGILGGKIVVGLFDSEQAVEQAVDALQPKGVGREKNETVRIIDRYRLSQKGAPDAPLQKLAVQPNRGLAPGNRPLVYDNPDQEPDAGTGAIEQEAYDSLVGLGLDKEEAAFFSRQIARGNSLVVVETSEECALVVLDVFKAANVARMTTADRSLL